MLDNCILINPWFVVKSFGLGNGGQFHQIFITGFIHGKQYHMKVMTCCFVMEKPTFLGHIKFTADKRFYAGLFGFFIKHQGAVHGAMISDGHCRHVIFQAAAYKVIKTDCAVEHGKLGMDMKMNKRCGHKSSWSMGTG